MPAVALVPSTLPVRPLVAAVASQLLAAAVAPAEAAELSNSIPIQTPVCDTAPDTLYPLEVTCVAALSADALFEVVVGSRDPTLHT